MKKILSLLMMLVPAYCTMAQQTLQLDISTGVLNGTNINNIPPSPLADGSNDDSWQCDWAPSSLQTFQTAKVAATPGAYATPPAGIKWIAPRLNASNKPDNVNSGYYLYRLNFSVPQCSQVHGGTITLNHLGADNQAIGIVVSNLSSYPVNGFFHTLNQSSTPLGQNITVNLALGEVNPGVNYIYVRTNSPAGANQTAPSALLINGNIQVSYTQLPIPAAPVPLFTVNPVYCLGATVTLNATMSQGVISSHKWLIEEYDSPTSTLANWYWFSPAFGYAPGMYTIPTGADGPPAFKCGKYYKVHLLVNNCSMPSNQHNGYDKFFYVACPPPVSLQGSSSSICLGGSGGISANLQGNLNPNNYTMTIVDLSVIGPPAAVIYSGTPNISIPVSPITTTTYQVTVTDNNTGCSTVQNWTMQVNTQSTPIYLNGSTAIICNGSTGGISAGIPSNLNASNYSMTIQEMVSGNIVYSGLPNISISLSPVVNTQYEITVVDNTTGCISKAYWTIKVVNGSLPLDFRNSSSQVCASVGQGGISVSLPLSYNPADYTMNIYDGSNTLVYSGGINMAILVNLSATTTYTVRVTDINTGCITTAYWTINVAACKTNGQLNTGTAPDQHQQNDIQVYPNPAKDIFHIQTTLQGQASLELYDVMGRLVYNGNIKDLSVENSLSLNGFGKGIYLLQIATATEVYYKKLIIE